MSTRRLYIALAIAAGVLAAPLAEARITRIEITTIEKPTFGGFSWPRRAGAHGGNTGCELPALREVVARTQQ